MNYYEVASQEAENLITEIGAIIVRTDLLPAIVVPPTIEYSYSLIPETSFANASITVADNANLDFGAGNFEINFDFKMSALNNGAHQFLMSKGTNLNNAWYLMYESIAGANLGHIFFVPSNNNEVINIDAGITDTTTYHNLKLKRAAGTTYLYIDDVLKGSSTASPIDTSGSLYVGAWNYTPSSHRFLGMMKNVTISKG